MTRVIVAGGRDYSAGPNFTEIMEQFINPENDILVSGVCKGADMEGYDWMIARDGDVHVFPAHWHTHGKAAGPIRNRQMAENADVLVAFWDGKSRGTRSMITEALNHGLEVHVYHYEEA